MLLFDTAFPPSAAQCVKMCRDYGASGWGVYIGGPWATNAWPANVGNYIVQMGFGVLPIYVGQQTGTGLAGLFPDMPIRRAVRRSLASGTLTRAQGLTDGQQAVRLMAAWKGPKCCLDVEAGTYSRNPTGTLAYWGGWRDAVRAGGYSPGIYAHLTQIDAFPGADFKWGAKYIQRTLQPYPTYNTAAHEWAWQYANSFTLDGVDVDASVGTLTLNGSSSPSPNVGVVTGGIGMGATTAGFVINGVTHILELSMDGDLLWWRGAGGGGAQIKAGSNGWWNLGGTGVPGGIRDFAAWPSDNQIVIRAKFITPTQGFAASISDEHPDELTRVAAQATRDLRAIADLAGVGEPPGLALGIIIWPDAPSVDKAYAMSWTQYPVGPYRLPSLPGAKGDPGDPGAPGPTGPAGVVDDDHIAAVAAAAAVAEITRRLENG